MIFYNKKYTFSQILSEAAEKIVVIIANVA